MILRHFPGPGPLKNRGDDVLPGTGVGDGVLSLALADGTRPATKMTPATAVVSAPLIAFFILIHLANSQLKDAPTLVRYDRTQHQVASALALPFK